MLQLTICITFPYSDKALCCIQVNFACSGTNYFNSELRKIYNAGNNVKLILFDEFLTYKQCVGKQFRSQTEGLLYLL
jgi:hypothetical protein